MTAEEKELAKMEKQLCRLESQCPGRASGRLLYFKDLVETMKQKARFSKQPASIGQYRAILGKH
eukprot:11195781-Lingulodinium_polyedra.AAC.1